jgi:hypothetical protein
MIRVTYICDKCASETTVELTGSPNRKDWLAKAQHYLKEINIDFNTFSVCKDCHADWKKVDKRKEKEKEEEFFGTENGNN